MKEHFGRDIKIGLIALVLALPLFFMYYRQLAFFTVNFDNYYDYVQWLNGVAIHPDFINPAAYRFLSYGLIALAYRLMPLIEFTGFSPDVPASLYKALQAQAMVAYLFQVALFWLSYRYVVNRMNLGLPTGLLTGVVVGALSHFTAYASLDPFMMWYLLLVLYYQDHRLLYAGLLLLSPVVNEKISLYLLIFFGGAVGGQILRRAPITWRHLLWPAFCFALFLGMKYVVDLPGYAEQETLVGLGDRLWRGIEVNFSLKGAYMNLLPTGLLLYCLYVSGVQGYFKDKIDRLWAYVGLLLVLFFICLAVMYDYTIGRGMMLSLPFFVPLIGFLVHRFTQPFAEV